MTINLMAIRSLFDSFENEAFLLIAYFDFILADLKNHSRLYLYFAYHNVLIIKIHL